MDLLNFALAGDGISLSWQGHNLDLHNCYDFNGFLYELPAGQVELTWIKSSQPWATVAVLRGLRLVFKNVSFLRLKERNTDYAFDEDNCLASLSFHPVEAREEFDSIWLNFTPTDDLTFFFQSEWGIKIQAETVELAPIS